MLTFIDEAPVTLSTKLSEDGYLTGRLRCSRTGVQTYQRKELGLTVRPEELIEVYRPPEAVFHKDSLATYGGKPIVMGHPKGGVVDAANWSSLAVGSMGTHITRDGETVVVDFAIMDAAAIAGVANGTKQVSMGYLSPIKFVDGFTPAGEPYEAVITGPIRINHLAVVPMARGGETLRIVDSASHWGATPVHQQESDMTMKSVVLGDASVQVAITDAHLIEAYRAAMDEKIGNLTAQVKTLTDAKLTPAQLSQRVAERVALETVAKSLDEAVVCDGVEDSAVRAAVVAKYYGDAAVKDQSEAYISGMFSALSATKPENGMRQVLGDAIGHVQQSQGGGWNDAVAAAAGVKFKKGV